jgi:adenosylhomocysteine nucleosidase
METIGLIAAMNQESDALIRLIKGSKRISLGQFKGFRFHCGDRSCVLIITGWGRKRAGEATRLLLAEANPQMLISFGIAGAVRSDLQIGDVVISTKSCVLEDGLPGQPQRLATLSGPAWKAVTEALLQEKASVFQGTTLTTHGSQVVMKQEDEFPHAVLDMETAGIAKVAAEKEVPLVSIRSISDNPQAPIPIDLQAAVDEEDNLLTGKLFMMIMRDPKIIFQSGRMLNNSRIAADNAALAVITMLNENSPIINE